MGRNRENYDIVEDILKVVVIPILVVMAIFYLLVLVVLYIPGILVFPFVMHGIPFFRRLPLAFLWPAILACEALLILGRQSRLFGTSLVQEPCKQFHNFVFPNDKYLKWD